MEKGNLKLNPLWNDKQLWEGKTKWRKAKPSNGLNLSVFRDAIIERFGPKIEDIDYIDVTDEEIEKGWQTVQKQLDK